MFDEEKSSLDVVRMIIKHGYPLNMIEHERFSIFVENLQPRFKLPSLDTLKADILRVYREEREKLRKYFEMLSCRFHLILNFLTCHDKKNRYCCFTLQFSEDGLKLKKKILALKSLENCTGETLCEMVKGLLREWKINKKLCSITVEHSSSNKKMVHNLDTWLDLQGYPPHKRTLFHIPCITHIINLLVQDGLDEIVLILHKIRKAIIYYSETADGAQKFHEVDLTSQRWDSIFFMLQSALKYEETFSYLQSRDYDFPVNISMEEWNSAKAIVECLKDFYDVVQRFLGSKCFITYMYFWKICYISKILLKWQKSEQELIRLIANKMKARFDNYCRDFIRVSAIAAVFDPGQNWTSCFSRSKKYMVKVLRYAQRLKMIFSEFLMDMQKTLAVSRIVVLPHMEIMIKHAPFTADMLLRLGNPVSTSGPEPPPARDSFLDLSSSSLSLEPQPQEAQSPSIICLLFTLLLRNDKHNSPNANTRPLLENIGSTSGPEPFPDESFKKVVNNTYITFKI
ncbi:putative ac transposase [Quercus suber]|uniref:Ac transposase n=1 Tax=Quercus suber TaxID=58331 RepID=A0AAW0INN3_QUESU